MLTAVTLENFKSYRKARLPLAPLTVMIGANASGKSNAIESMRLLSWLAQGQKLSAIQYLAQQGNALIRGTLRDLPFEGETFGLGAETDDPAWNRLSMTIESRADGLHIVNESLTQDDAKVPLYWIETPSTSRGTDCIVAYNNFAKGPNKPRVTCSDQEAIFSQLDKPATFAADHGRSRTEIPPTVKRLEAWLSNMLFLDPVPAQMRDYAFPSDKVLRGDGKNLSAVLYNLWQVKPTSELIFDPRDPEPVRESILSFVRSLPEQDISSLQFLEEPRGGVMVQLTETFGGRAIARDASLLSDGTLRVLSIAAALLSAPEGSLVVIEEIDNGVHPSRARHLLENIRSVAESRGLRVLLSTHNPAMLDALPDAALADVLFCYRDPSEGESRVVRLQDLPDYPELIAQDSLGGLVTSGTLERFVKSGDSEDRVARGLDWLAQMKAGAEP